MMRVVRLSAVRRLQHSVTAVTTNFSMRGNVVLSNRLSGYRYGPSTLVQFAGTYAHECTGFHLPFASLRTFHARPFAGKSRVRTWQRLGPRCSTSTRPCCGRAASFRSTTTGTKFITAHKYWCPAFSRETFWLDFFHLDIGQSRRRIQKDKCDSVSLSKSIRITNGLRAIGFRTFIYFFVQFKNNRKKNNPSIRPCNNRFRCVLVHRQNVRNPPSEGRVPRAQSAARSGRNSTELEGGAQVFRYHQTSSTYDNH